MCATCGCGDVHQHHEHEHEHDSRRLRLEHDVLAKNDELAEINRAWLARRRVAALNLLGSPGAGKTTLLERSIRELSSHVSLSVLEGDQETDRDAERIRRAGARAFQINTGTVCHLDAHAVGHALEALQPAEGSVVIVENVGNLVCPALFDLGERAKVLVLSVTEGDDKPAKYPNVFRASDVLVISKTDLLPHVEFDVDRCIADARRVNPKLMVFELSAATGNGLAEWCAWLAAAAPS